MTLTSGLVRLELVVAPLLGALLELELELAQRHMNSRDKQTHKHSHMRRVAVSSEYARTWPAHLPHTRRSTEPEHTHRQERIKGRRFPVCLAFQILCLRAVPWSLSRMHGTCMAKSISTVLMATDFGFRCQVYQSRLQINSDHSILTKASPVSPVISGTAVTLKMSTSTSANCVVPSSRFPAIK